MFLIKNGALTWVGLHSLLKAANAEPISIAAENPIARKQR